MSECIFCRILEGEIPAFRIHEDDATLAFMDINPISEGHLLIIPKKHFANIWDSDPEALGRVMSTTKLVATALRDVLGIDSMNLLQANGRWAVQTVEHFHLHLIPRRENDGVGLDWGLTPGDMAAIKQVADRLAQKLG